MTLIIIQETFETIKNCDILSDLYEHKLNFMTLMSEVHKKMHAGPSVNSFESEAEYKSEQMSMIKHGETLMEFLNDKIDLVKEDELSKRKNARARGAMDRDAINKDYQEKNRFFLMAKKHLAPALFNHLLNQSKVLSQKEIEALPQKN